MIAFLKGNLIHQSGTTLVIDVNGVGYEVLCSGSLLESVKENGSEVQAVIQTEMKESSLSLFGFSSFGEREVFSLLRKVKGIGPRIALNIISHVGTTQLLRSIGTEDYSALKKVPGVGKKTAERLVVELREQVVELLANASEEQKVSLSAQKALSTPCLTGQTAEAQDACLALQKLGFNESSAKQAVEAAISGSKKLQTNESKLTPGELLRMALANIPSRG